MIVAFQNRSVLRTIDLGCTFGRVDAHIPSILPPESFTMPIQELQWPARVMFPLKLSGLKEVSTAVQGRVSPYYSLLQRTEKDHVTVLFNVYIC